MIEIQKVTTFLMFEGQAEEAMNLYLSVFPESEVIHIDRYGPDEDGVEGTVRLARFSLAGQEYMCIDSSISHEFTFTPSISLYVECDSEAEFDELFAKLSDGGSMLMPPDNYGFSTKFGWLADRFGVSWQVNFAG